MASAMASVTAKESSPKVLAEKASSISWFPLASGPNPSSTRVTTRFRGRSRGLASLSAVARIREPSASSSVIAAGSASTPSIATRRTAVTTVSLKRFFKPSRTPPSTLARLPNV